MWMEELATESFSLTRISPSPAPRRRRNCNPTRRHRWLLHHFADSTRTSPVPRRTTLTRFIAVMDIPHCYERLECLIIWINFCSDQGCRCCQAETPWM